MTSVSALPLIETSFKVLTGGHLSFITGAWHTSVPSFCPYGFIEDMSSCILWRRPKNRNFLLNNALADFQNYLYSPPQDTPSHWVIHQQIFMENLLCGRYSVGLRALSLALSLLPWHVKDTVPFLFCITFL